MRFKYILALGKKLLVSTVHGVMIYAKHVSASTYPESRHKKSHVVQSIM